MEILIVILLGLALAVLLSVVVGARYWRALARADAHDGTGQVLSQLDTDAPRAVVSWPAAWGRPTVAEVIREAVARGWAVESQAVADGEHIMTLRRT